jgi:hypothetical protein
VDIADVSPHTPEASVLLASGSATGGEAQPKGSERDSKDACVDLHRKCTPGARRFHMQGVP